ncbi:MAG: glycosyltransferase family 4 protein [Actinomycetota bacterium]|nr:glycosyltransferase family 4 protein [Actinomycetota bacterium]
MLLVNDVATVGGGQTVMLGVARVLLEAGFDAHVACPPGPLADDSAALGAKWHDFQCSERRVLTSTWRVPRPQAVAARVREGRRLAALADDVGAQIVHTGAQVPHLDVQAARPHLRASTLWHLNQVHPRYMFAGPLPDKIIGVSQAALRPASWRPAVNRRSVVVSNGIDVDRFRPPTPDERASARDALGLGSSFTVVTVARLEPLKGIDVLIRAAARTGAKPTLLIIGDATGFVGGGAYGESLNQLATTLGVNARFLGHRADVPTLLWAADVFAFASRWEAFGLVLAEASASALPVVSTDIGGCSEVVDCSSGLLVGRDDAAGFAAAFDRLADDASLRRELGAAGRRRVLQMFDGGRLGQRLIPHYLELAAGR